MTSQVETSELTYPRPACICKLKLEIVELVLVVEPEGKEGRKYKAPNR
jgi:hypothetical protein